MRSATPTHSRPVEPSWLTCAESACPRRSSSASSSKGRSRRLFSVAASVMMTGSFPEILASGSAGERRLRLRDQLVGRDGLHHVVDRALAQTPDPVGLLPFGR